ncbi:hypothetical protein HO133_004256 [Letharia lupina]|uniref:Uncharacterized protein n=1 Tax=Letharia lupina TaxID=560253 RepID=A0A8H6KZG6_9LECA|nr:uncharacterized protein HO133_004256 [Letharia lupina]KAF6229919.1 hypothetical protein HO133_004256 [Letharia lupina]
MAGEKEDRADSSDEVEDGDGDDDGANYAYVTGEEGQWVQDESGDRPIVGASGSHGTAPPEPLRDHYYSSDLHRMHTKPDGSRSDDRDRQYGNNNRGSNSGEQDSHRYFETASEPRPSIIPRQQEPFASRLIPTMVVIEAGISTTAEPRGEEIRTAFSMHPTARPML